MDEDATKMCFSAEHFTRCCSVAGEEFDAPIAFTSEVLHYAPTIVSLHPELNAASAYSGFFQEL